MFFNSRFGDNIPRIAIPFGVSKFVNRTSNGCFVLAHSRICLQTSDLACCSVKPPPRITRKRDAP